MTPFKPNDAVVIDRACKAPLDGGQRCERCGECRLHGRRGVLIREAGDRWLVSIERDDGTSYLAFPLAEDLAKPAARQRKAA